MCVITFEFLGSEVGLPPSWATPTHTAQPWHPPSECQITCSNRMIRVYTGEMSKLYHRRGGRMLRFSALWNLDDPESES